MLISAAAILAMQIAAAGTPIGVAAASPDGQICIAMAAPTLTVGTTLTLLRPNAPQTVLVASVVRPVSSCERLERAMIPGPYYLAHRVESTTSDSGVLWVALPGALTTRRIASGAVTVQLSVAYPDAQVRSCTSREGLHLTVWAGIPLTSERLWHRYFYLGYDVEPSCEDRDMHAAG